MSIDTGLDATASLTEFLEADLAGDLSCCSCEHAAIVRMRLHLPNREACDTGCSTRTVFMCKACRDEMVEVASAGYYPVRCLCNQVLTQVSDIIIWIRPLR